MPSKIRNPYLRRNIKRHPQKVEELSYLDSSIRKSILKEIITGFGINSQVSMVGAELLLNADRCEVGIEDYYLRTTCQDYQTATREYVLLITSYILVSRWMINVKSSKNIAAIKNAVLFETCKFKY